MKKLADKDYSNKILELSRRESSGNDEALITEAMAAYVRGDYGKIDEILEKMSEDYKLLEALINKLKGKSVYNNLRKILMNESIDVLDAKIALNSLLTHIYIEQKTTPEYKLLERVIKDKLVKYDNQ